MSPQALASQLIKDFAYSDGLTAEEFAQIEFLPPSQHTDADQYRSGHATQAIRTMADWVAIHAPAAVPQLRQAGLPIWTPGDGYGNGHPDE